MPLTHLDQQQDCHSPHLVYANQHFHLALPYLHLLPYPCSETVRSTRHKSLLRFV